MTLSTEDHLLPQMIVFCVLSEMLEQGETSGLHKA